MAYNKERLEFYRRRCKHHIVSTLEDLNAALTKQIRDLIIGQIKLHDGFEAALAENSELFAKEVPLEQAIERWAVTYASGRLDIFAELETLEEEIGICFETSKESE